jgi:ABC-type hemin transport system ATPase subunit
MAAEVTEQTVVMYKGKVVASGKTEQILFDSNLMEKYDLEVPCIFSKR